MKYHIVRFGIYSSRVAWPKYATPRKGEYGNWKNELSNSQIKYIEKELNSEMKFLGYL